MLSNHFYCCPGNKCRQKSFFNVRGGGADQNLILLDEATIFLSCFLVFPNMMLKDLKLYKGGIPANFGGRVSSVLDIYQKTGAARIPHEWRYRINFQ
jgi:hypothetical protein